MIIKSSYNSRFGWGNGHLQTIVPALLRSPKVTYHRNTYRTNDNDELSLDWIKKNKKKCVVISHGLEGSSSSFYVAGLAQYIAAHDFDVCAWNYRACDGKTNKKLGFYHSGFTADLKEVVAHVCSKYQEVYLVGFSIGANITLKYLGQEGAGYLKEIKKAVCFSAPTDLRACSQILDTGFSKVYRKRFLLRLKQKLIDKNNRFPNAFDLSAFGTIKTLTDFDNAYTAPLYGFKDAADYYKQSSAKQFIQDIKLPTLIISAQNDPFLAPQAYPIQECKHHQYVDLEMPKAGGHCGFLKSLGAYWSDERVVSFFE